MAFLDQNLHHGKGDVSWRVVMMEEPVACAPKISPLLPDTLSQIFSRHHTELINCLATVFMTKGIDFVEVFISS
jgi:hypothetical protein